MPLMIYSHHMAKIHALINPCTPKMVNGRKDISFSSFLFGYIPIIWMYCGGCMDRYPHLLFWCGCEVKYEHRDE